MTRSVLAGLSLVVALSAASVVAAERDVRSPYVVGSKVPLAAEAFDLSRVRLLDGPFKEAMDRDTAYLLRLDPDRLLSSFRADAGLKPKAERYGGWESMGVAGHCLGHHLSACAMAYQSTGDRRFLDRVNYIVDELAECQAANGDGYVSAIPDGKRVFAEVARGDIRSKGFDLNGLWVPWYTQHKVYAGLRDAHVLCGNDKAKAVLIRSADWALKVTDGLSPQQIHTMLRCEHGGMNEVAADVYAMTGDERYLTLARRFNDHHVLDPLAQGKDVLPGLHANTQIPKLIGLARQHELTGDAWARDAARFFWQTVTHNHSYATGSNSNGEYFGPPRQLAERLSDSSGETCNVYNMLKLTRHLHAWTADPTYADYHERALFNHILASQEPREGRVTYFISLKSGSQKTYQAPFDSFSCCVGTGMENHVKYGEGIYSRGPGEGATLYVNQFVASELDWSDRGIRVRQETRYPEADSTRLTFDLAQETPITVHVRYPAWATDGMTVRVNGQAVDVSRKPGSYVTVSRHWKAGDTLDVRVPMALRLEPTPDDPNRVAVLYGPVVLAGALGNDGELLQRTPVVVAQGKAPSDWLKPVEGKPLTFATAGVGRPADVTLIPFYKLHHQHQLVYWDLFTEGQWAKREADYRAEQERKRRLEARTIDFLQPGEMQPERDHDVDGHNTRAGSHWGGKWRDAFDGGWFAFTMKVNAGQPAELICTYWGDDGQGRDWDILVEGQKVATVSLKADKPGKFWDATYPIPASLTAGKDRVTIKFQAHPGKLAGGLFGCRMVKPGDTSPGK